MKKTLILATVVLCLAAMVLPVQAADEKWMMRGRMIYIAPSADADGDLTGIDVDSQYTFEVDFTRFFTKNLALEVSLATASHDVTAEDVEATTPGATEFSLGSVDILPPSFMLQWHFFPDGTIKPYIGLGFNYTTFYNTTGILEDLDFGDSLSYAAQAGLDWKLGEKAYLNFDLKYIAIESDVEIDGSELGTVTVDPIVVGVGLGFKF